MTLTSFSFLMFLTRKPEGMLTTSFTCSGCKLRYRETFTILKVGRDTTCGIYCPVCTGRLRKWKAYALSLFSNTRLIHISLEATNGKEKADGNI